MSVPSPGLVQSVHDRLVRLAHQRDFEPNLVFSRFAAERLLYRLSASRHVDRFVLKGAFLLVVWLGEAVRPTRDVDLLGFGNLPAEALREIFREICSLEVEPDGLVFPETELRIAPIRRGDAFGGQRLVLWALLGRARFRVQIDVAVGTMVTPPPEWVTYPTLLDLPSPRLRAYRPETSIAEKLHAMVDHGAQNSRLRDYFDLVTLARRERFDGRVLVDALRDTFQSRDTRIPAGLPLGLTRAFAEIEGKRAQWRSFLTRSRLPVDWAELETVIDEVAEFLGPVLTAASRESTLAAVWRPDGAWTEEDG